MFQIESAAVLYLYYTDCIPHLCSERIFFAKRNFRFNFKFRFRSESEGAPYLEHTKQKLLGISSIEQFVMILSGTFKRILTVSGMFIADPGSDFGPSRITDLNFFHPGSPIHIKEFKYFNTKKCF